MYLIDMHCDTVSKLMNRTGETLWENGLCVDIPGLKRAGSLIQFFACFVNIGKCKGPDKWGEGYRAVWAMMERMKQETKDALFMAASYEEILKNKSNGNISAILTVEEGGVLDNQISRLEKLYQAGVRLMTLTWNYENCIGSPNSRDENVMRQGLKPFGIEVVEQMNHLKMLVDVSHLSDGGFWDCIRHSRSPIVASHSNARALCGHPRNLSDDMLKALAKKGGVAGLNFYPVFLRDDGAGTLEDIARHAKHMIHVAGEDIVAIGTDFDGFDISKGNAIPAHISQMEQLYASFKRAGITPGQIEKIWYKNAKRVIQDVM